MDTSPLFYPQSLLRWLGLCVMLWLLSGTSQATTPDKDNYIGTAACKNCHLNAWQDWQDSDHSWSMREATAPNVKGDFNDAKFAYFGQTSRFYRKGEQFWFAQLDASGTLQHYQIRYTFGVYPLQQYLVGFEDGRYQVLNIAWDSRSQADGGQRWFHLFPDRPVLYDSPLHWQGSYQRWNSRCATCHSTNFKKNFDPASQHYNSQWSQLSIGCEACHGPGAGHLHWAQTGKAQSLNAPAQFGLTRWLKGGSQWQRSADQATASNHGQSNPAQLDSCAGCHARRTLLAEGGAEHKDFEQGHQLRLLEPPLYHADGQIQDEVFVLGSFLQSKMHQRGVECSNCHNPHSLKLKAPGNALCSQCHAPAVFDQPDHHQHPAGSSGAQCVNCHMPATTYMQVDPRRDHSLRIPRPDLSVGSERPNACNNCHQDQSPAWAATALQGWLAERGKTLAPHFSEPLTAQARGQGDSRAQLSTLLTPELPAIVRASALQRLSAFVDQQGLTQLQQASEDKDPLVRRAALVALQNYPLRYRMASAVTGLFDSSKAVRLSAFALLLEIRPAQLPTASRGQFNQVQAEYQQWLALHADTPDGQLRLGNYRSARQQLNEAEQHYRQALRYNPQFVPALLNLAELYRRQQRDDQVQPLLQQGLEIAPDNAALHYAQGLLSVRQKHYRLAAEQLQQAMNLQPDNVQYGYVAAVALEASGQLNAAIALLQKLQQRFPDDGRIRQTLAEFQTRK